MSHYCKICGCYLPNEKFSGKGHTQHICKDCAKLPTEKKAEMQTINRLMNLPLRLSKENRKWLEKMRKDEREDVRSAAQWAWDIRFTPAPSSDDEDEDFDLSFASDEKDDWGGADPGDIDPDELPF